VAQKLESDYRYDAVVKEREKFNEKERILLNTFDLWKSKFDSSNKPEESVKASGPTPPSGSNIYECDKCVYEASTLIDLKEHKKDNHDEPNFKCDECGHTVLTAADLEGHKQAYHEAQKRETKNIQMVFLCDDCEYEFQTKTELADHIKKEHTIVDDFKCDKCDFTGSSLENLDKHRRSVHFFFIYYCGACNFETTNIEVFKKHKRNNHGGTITETRKSKVIPPPKCNPKDVSHSSECCDRDPRDEKVVIYSHDQRHSNGICLDWNKGSCDQFELCKYLHIK
jgi:DNA-directed RNA polymerase subunit M/transcription elongation factor TFIIS